MYGLWTRDTGCLALKKKQEVKNKDFQNRSSYHRVIKSVIFITGLGGIVGQLILIRELMITFYGNELTWGLVLASWLVFEAAGSFTVSHVKYFKNSSLYIIFIILYALFLPLALYFSRSIDVYLFHILPGETAGLFQLFISSLILVGPVSFVHGSLFPLAAEALSEVKTESLSFGIGPAYIWETAGTLTGGVMFTLVLARFFHSFQIGMGIILLHLIGGLILLGIYYPDYKKLKLIFLSIFCILFVSGIFLTNIIQDKTLERQFSGQNVVFYENTAYGNIVVTREREEHTFYYDGRPLFTDPAYDLGGVADFVHLSLTAHQKPKNILVLGGGIGGIINEVVGHQPESITYVELDGRLPEITQKLPLSLVPRELALPQVNVIQADARFYLRQTEKKYDLVIIGFLEPETLQTNRLFTREFFSLAADRLKEQGLMAFSLPGSLTYLGTELASYSRTMQLTAEDVFQQVSVIPGERSIYLASNSSFELNPQLLWNRMENRGLQDNFMSPGYLEYRLSQERQEWFLGELQEGRGEINSDLRPVGFFQALNYWGRTFAPRLQEYLFRLQQYSEVEFLGGLIVLCVLVIILIRLFFYKKSRVLIYAVGTTGMCALAFDLLILFVFQTLFGFIYQMMGLLLAAYMGGMAGGAALEPYFSNRVSAPDKLFKSLEAVIILLLGLFFGLVLIMQQLAGTGQTAVLIMSFTIFAVLSGGVTGMEFPAAARIRESTGRKEESTKIRAGLLYGADLLGGWLAGILISLLMFPLLGLKMTLLFLASLKVISLLFLFMGE